MNSTGIGSGVSNNMRKRVEIKQVENGYHIVKDYGVSEFIAPTMDEAMAIVASIFHG